MTAFKAQIVSFIIVYFAGFLTLTDPSREIAAFVCGAFWGFHLRWYYPSEKLIYAVIIPQGQEIELAGFFLYCTQILTFLPPLIFYCRERGRSELALGRNPHQYIFVCWISILPTHASMG